MADTSIEWTDATWNPVRGCSRVSPGCDNCYAMRFAHRFSNPGSGTCTRGEEYKAAGRYHGLTTIRRGKVDWSGRVRLVPEMLDAPLRWRKPRRIFVNSMSDLFHESLSDEAIAAVFGVMAAAPQHTFQVLTKRAKRMREWFEWFERGNGRQDSADVAITAALGVPELNAYVTRNDLDVDDEPSAWDELIEDPPDWPLRNVWLGVSAEDQERADERIPHLLETPAAVRFVSAEPLLGPVDFASFLPFEGHPGGIDWLIVGGESGHGARLCDVAWIRDIVRQCRRAGVSCFVKQLGARPDFHDDVLPHTKFSRLLDRKGGAIEEWPHDLQVRQWPEVSE